jgi:hypothetical protein
MTMRMVRLDRLIKYINKLQIDTNTSMFVNILVIVSNMAFARCTRSELVFDLMCIQASIDSV